MTRTLLSRCVGWRAALALLLGLAATTASADYIKIANSGSVLPDSAVLGSNPTDWACTYDSTAGLLWEVKTDDGGLHDKDNRYTNYDSNFGTQTQIDAATNSIGFVNAVNAAGLCGFADWRRPSKDELLGLVVTGSTPTIDTTYFPNTPASLFWSGSPLAGSSDYAWVVDFDYGNDYGDYRFLASQVRLVRAGQLIDHLVTLTGTGAGRVVADGIDCARLGGVSYGTCANQQWPGGTATLTATPAAGSAVTWGGDCAGATGTTCTLTLDADKSVTADFSAPIATRAVLVDPDSATTLYAGLDGAGVYVSADSGGTWTAATTPPTNLNVKALAKKSGTPLYAGSYGTGVFKATTGTNFAACTTQPANANVLSLTLDAAGKLYAGTEAGVFVSADACASWAALNNGLPN